MGLNLSRYAVGAGGNSFSSTKGAGEAQSTCFIKSAFKFACRTWSAFARDVGRHRCVCDCRHLYFTCTTGSQCNCHGLFSSHGIAAIVFGVAIAAWSQKYRGRRFSTVIALQGTDGQVGVYHVPFSLFNVDDLLVKLNEGIQTRTDIKRDIGQRASQQSPNRQN